MRPATLRLAAELAADKPHGVRVRYMAGCRCLPCRAANASYAAGRERARARGDRNGLVPADRARAHLRRLRRAGVGRRAVSRAAGVTETVLVFIQSGRRQQIRERTERRILGVVAETGRAGGSLVSAKPTWARIRALLAEGYTRGALAQLLGAQRPALQLGRVRVTAAKARAVEALHRRLTSIEWRAA